MIREENETVFEHLRFALKVARDMFISSIFFTVHGFTGGLAPIPERYNVCAMAERLCEAKEDRLSKLGENEVDEQKEIL